MSSFRANPISTPPRWCLNVTTNSASATPLSRTQMTCKFGSSCIKFGCPFKHPSSRPRDCPDGEFCDEEKCPLHHPKSRPIRQHKYPQSRQGMCQSNGSYPVPRLANGMAAVYKNRNGLLRARSLSELDKNLTPKYSRRRATSCYSNRAIVRSPMVVPTPNARPTTGYFAATTKPCARGTTCMEYGCTYKHPASRVGDCPLGINCNNASCALLHPLNEDGTGAADAGFMVGQKVQARFLPNSSKWSDATIRHIRGSVITLQFDGFVDAFDIPLQRVRHHRHGNDPLTPVCRHDNNDPFAPVCPHTPPPPQSPSSMSDVEDLEQLKLAAVAREDFVVAEQIKQRIATVKKIADLEQQKQQAVCDEDFLLAMDLKKKIAELESAKHSSTTSSTASTDTCK